MNFSSPNRYTKCSSFSPAQKQAIKEAKKDSPTFDQFRHKNRLLSPITHLTLTVLEGTGKWAAMNKPIIRLSYSGGNSVSKEKQLETTKDTLLKIDFLTKYEVVLGERKEYNGVNCCFQIIEQTEANDTVLSETTIDLSAIDHCAKEIFLEGVHPVRLNCKFAVYRCDDWMKPAFHEAPKATRRASFMQIFSPSSSSSPAKKCEEATEQPSDSLSPLKRKTICVQSSASSVPRESISKRLRESISKGFKGFGSLKNFDGFQIRKYLKGKQTLTEIMAQERKVFPHAEIPAIVEKILDVVKHPKFLKEEGVLRKSANHQTLKDLKEKSLFQITDEIEVHTLIGLLKEFLMSLPQGGILGDIKPVRLDTIAHSDVALKDFIWEMPVDNRVLLRKLFEYFLLLSSEPTSKMNPSNIGVCIGNSLMPTVTKSEDMTAVCRTASALSQLVQTGLQHFDSIFDMTEEDFEVKMSKKAFEHHVGGFSADDDWVKQLEQQQALAN